MLRDLTRDFSLSALVASFVAILVGFTSSVLIVFSAAQALGVTPAQTTSWMWALGLGMSMGLTSIGLSQWTRQRVLTAWSKPGAALIAGSSGFGMAEATGAFVACVARVDAIALVIHMGTVSKSLFPLLRLGCLLAPPALVASLQAIVSQLMQGGRRKRRQWWRALGFIGEGHYASYMRRMRKPYAKRHEVLRHAAAKPRQNGKAWPRDARSRQRTSKPTIHEIKYCVVTICPQSPQGKPNSAIFTYRDVFAGSSCLSAAPVSSLHPLLRKLP